MPPKKQGGSGKKPTKNGESKQEPKSNGQSKPQDTKNCTAGASSTGAIPKTSTTSGRTVAPAGTSSSKGSQKKKEPEVNKDSHTAHTVMPPKKQGGSGKKPTKNGESKQEPKSNGQSKTQDTEKCTAGASSTALEQPRDNERRVSPGPSTTTEKKMPSMKDLLQNPKLIRERMNHIRLKMEHIQQASEDLEDVLNGVLEKVSELDPLFKWQNLNVGSYYERLKIIQPDEFDINVEAFDQPGQDILSNFYTVLNNGDSSISPGFCTILVHRIDRLKDLVTQCGDGYYFCVRKFIKRFHHLVTEAFRILGKAERVKIAKLDAICPAVKVTFQGKGWLISIDLVPSLRIPWPAALRQKWKPIWPTQRVYADINNVHAVAKTHASERKMPANRAILWRISFSQIEKSLISHADGTANPRKSKKTFRKDFMKIMKSFLEFEVVEALKKKGIKEDHRSFCSYHLKTLALNMFNKRDYKNVSHWLYDRLPDNLRDALNDLRSHINNKDLPHHFNPSMNLFKELPPFEQQIISEQIDLALSEE